MWWRTFWSQWALCIIEAYFIFAVDLSLLQLDSVVAEVTVQKMGPADVVLQINKHFEACFMVGEHHLIM
jgi:hypothetical protein